MKQFTKEQRGKDWRLRKEIKEMDKLLQRRTRDLLEKEETRFVVEKPHAKKKPQRSHST